MNKAPFALQTKQRGSKTIGIDPNRFPNANDALAFATSPLGVVRGFRYRIGILRSDATGAFHPITTWLTGTQ